MRYSRFDGDSRTCSAYKPLYCAYENYKSRGLEDIWGNYRVFKEWSLSNGWKLGLVLSKDRRWTTRAGLNNPSAKRSKTILVEVNREVYTLPNATKRFTSLSYSAIYKRYQAGKVEDLLHDPLTGFTGTCKIIR